MYNSYNSSFDSESQIIEMIKRQQVSQQQLPKLMQTPSDLKPPTINSSFINCASPFTEPIRSYLSNRDNNQNNFEQNRKAKTLNNHSEEIEGKVLDESGTKQRKKSHFNKSMRSSRKLPLYTELNQTESISRNLLEKKYVKQFINNLMSKAYIFRDTMFNTYQKKLLQENYLDNQFFHSALQDNYQKILNPIYFLIWDLIFFLLILILFIWLPFYIGFLQQSNIIFDIFIITFIFIDIFITFYKPQIQEGNLISVKFQNLKQFFHSEILFINVIYVIATILIITISISQIIQWIILIIQIISGIKILNYILQRISDFIPFDFELLKIMSQIVYGIHLCSCFWYYIGSIDSDSWINNLNFEESDDFTKYCISLYMSITMLMNIGQGSISLQNNTELIFASIMMFLSCWLLAFIIKHMGYLLQQKYDSLQKNKKQMDQVNFFLQKRGISLQMAAKIRNYLKFIQQQDNNDNQMQIIIQQLSPVLREELYIQMRIKALMNCKSISKFSKETLEQLTQIMDYEKFNPNELIIQKGKTDDNSLYIIDEGEVQIIDQKKILATLRKGDSFGEYCFFQGGQRSASAQALGFVAIYKIEQIKFQQLIQKNKVDHERYMYIKDSLLNQKYQAAQMQCFSCKSYNHLIQKCPIWTYKSDLEKIYKKENYKLQERSKFDRAIKEGRRDTNRVFDKLILNYDALKILRLKYDIIYDDDDDDDEDDILEDEDVESYSELSDDDYLSEEGFSDNKQIQEKQEGTIVSILKQQDQIKENNSKVLQEIEDDDQMFIIRPNNQKGTLSTAQFQHQNDFQQQQQQLYKFSLVPSEPLKVRRTSTPQETQQYIQITTSSQLIANEVPIPSVNRIKNTPHITFKGDTDSQLSQNQQSSRLRSNTGKKTTNFVDKRKKNLSRIREEDSDTLNLSNRQQSDEYATSPYGKQLGRQSQSSSQVRQSMKRFSSKLSSIPTKQNTMTQVRSTVSPITRSNIHIPTAIGMVDLSMYRRNDPQSEEFERMYQYSLYFPIDNYQLVINRINYFLKWKLSSYIQSKYTFQYYVKELISKFNKILKVEMNPD